MAEGQTSFQCDPQYSYCYPGYGFYPGGGYGGWRGGAGYGGHFRGYGGWGDFGNYEAHYGGFGGSGMGHGGGGG